jgi:lipopolysaccharide export system protein LptC
MWHLSGENPTFLDDSKISIQKPKLLFFGQKGDANIRADKAIVSGNAKHCEMIGAVEAKYQNSQHVKTQHALIDMSSQTVTFPGPFQAQIEKSELKANKGRLDLKPYQIITYGPSELDYIP